MRPVFLILYTIAVISCTDKSDGYQPPREFHEQTNLEMKLLLSQEQLSLYLGDIRVLDQANRKKEIEILENPEQGPDEVEAIKTEIDRIDIENLVRIEAIFRTFGYPKKDSVGFRPANVSCEVITRSTNFETQRTHFNRIYNAYLNGDVHEILFELYLDGMYVLKFEEDFKMPSPYRLEEKIQAMIEVLELDDQVDTENASST